MASLYWFDPGKRSHTQKLNLKSPLLRLWRNRASKNFKTDSPVVVKNALALEQHQQNAETKTLHRMQCFVTWLRRVIKRTQKGRRRGLPKWGPAYAVDGNQYSQPRTDGIAVRTGQGTLGRVAWRTFKNPRDELCWCQCCILRAMISCLGDHSSTRWVPRSRWLFHRSLFHLAN
jgi:hypothetical protein